MEGREKLLLTATKSLQALTPRIGQLVGASISKAGHGLIPVSDELPSGPKTTGEVAWLRFLTMQGPDDKK